MAIPKICFDKVFWVIITASFSFTIFLYNIESQNYQTVSAQVEQNTKTIYSMTSIQSDVHDLKQQLQQQTQDIADIKAQLKNLH